MTHLIKNSAKTKPRSIVMTIYSRRPEYSRVTSFPRAATRAAMRAAENAVPLRLLKFFLGDHNTRPGPFIRGIFGGHRKAASPYKIAATREHRPAVTLPPADVPLVQ